MVGTIGTTYVDVGVNLIKKEYTNYLRNTNGLLASNNDGYILVRSESGTMYLYKENVLLKTFSGVFDTTSHCMTLSDCYYNEDKIEMLLFYPRGNFNTKVDPYFYKISFDNNEWNYVNLSISSETINNGWSNGAWDLFGKFIKTSQGLYLVLVGGGNDCQLRTAEISYNFFSNETNINMYYNINYSYGGNVGSRDLIVLDAFTDINSGNVIVNYIDKSWKSMYILNNTLSAIINHVNYSSNYSNSYTNSRYLISEEQYVQTTYSNNTVNIRLYNKVNDGLIDEFSFNCTSSNIFVGYDKNKCFYIVCQNNNNYYIYILSIINNEMSLINSYIYSYSSINTEKGRVISTSYNYRAFNCDNKIVLFINSNNNKQLISMTKDDKTYRYIDQSINTGTEFVLSGKKYYNTNGEKIGTMINNGAIQYTPSDTVINIANGYHNGSTVKAVDITTLNDYQVCENLSESILGDYTPYTELTYLTMDGNQYIDPNITANQNTIVEIKYLLTGASAGYGRIIGGGSDMNYELCATGNITNLRWSLNGNASNVSITSGIAHIYKCYGNGNLDLDGINNVNRSINQSNTKLWLFDSFSHSERAKGNFYYCKIWQSGTLVRDFIPVKDLNNVVCLYDTVNGDFYYNQGSGNFIAGGVV